MTLDEAMDYILEKTRCRVGINYYAEAKLWSILWYLVPDIRGLSRIEYGKIISSFHTDLVRKHNEQKGK